MFQKPFSFNSSSSTSTTTTNANASSPNPTSSPSNRNQSDLHSINSNKSNKSSKSQNTINSIRSRQDSLIFERLVQDQLLDYQPNNTNFSTNKKIHTENYIPSSLDSTTIMINSPSSPLETSTNNTPFSMDSISNNINNTNNNNTPFEFIRRPSMVNLESALTNGMNSKRNSISMVNMKKSSSTNTNNNSSNLPMLTKTNSSASLSYADMLSQEEKDLQSRLNLSNFRRPSISQQQSSTSLATNSNGVSLTRNNSNRSLRSPSIVSAENLARSPILSRSSTTNNSNNVISSSASINNTSNTMFNRQSIPLTRSNSRLTNQLNKFQLGGPHDDTEDSSSPTSPLINQNQFSPPRQQQQQQTLANPPQFVRTNSLAGLSRKLSVTAQTSPMLLPNNTGSTSNSSTQLPSPISNLSSQMNKSKNSLLLKKKKQLNNKPTNSKVVFDDIERSTSNDTESNDESFVSDETCDKDLTENLQKVII